MFSWLKQLLAQPVALDKAATPEHLKLKVAQKDIPRYPPFMKGLPTHSPQELVETQADLVLALKQSCDATQDEFDRFYKASILRFAAFAHLLPASQAHHHRGAGGLLRHSLEVGLWALREADKMPLIELTKMPGRKGIIVPRWQLTSFLAGLCHDIGKPMTDVSVRNHAATSHWKPVKEPLWAWINDQKIDAYFLEWQENRGKKHVTFTAAMAKHVITDDELEWIGEGDTALLGWLMETLNGTPSNTNPLYDVVIRADQKSVERDLKSMGAAMAGYDLGVPVERMLIDIMHSLIRQGIWSVNEPGAKVWCIEGTVFLVWPTSGQDIAAEVHRDSIPGVPRSPDAILDMLIERQLAFMNEGELYKIAPAVLAAKIPDIKFSAVRLRDDTLVSKMPLPSVDGTILNVKRTSTQASPDHVEPAPESVPSSATAAAPAKMDAGEPAAAQSYAGAAQEPATGSSDSAEQASLPADKPAAAESPAPVHKPAGNKPSKNARSVPTAKANTATPEEPAKETPTAPPVPAVHLEGALGEALKALAGDLKSGSKSWGEHAVQQDDGRILLMWPAAFSGYGLAPKAIIEEFTERNWCSSDENFPTRKVVEVEIDGALVRVIRLHHDVSEAMARLMGRSKAAKPAAPAAQAPQKSEPESGTAADTPPPPEVHEPVSAQAPVRGSQSTQQKPVIDSTKKQGAADPQQPELQHAKKRKKKHPKEAKPATASAVSAPVALEAKATVQEQDQGKALTAEDMASRELNLILTALRKLPAKSAEDGWLSAPVHDSIKGIEEHSGISVSRSMIYRMARDNSDKLKMRNGHVLFLAA